MWAMRAMSDQIAGEVMRAAQSLVERFEAHVRERIYVRLIDAFENDDWDTQDECRGRDKAFDAALKNAHPDWYHGE